MTRTAILLKLGRRCNKANIVTGIRFVCSIALLFFPVFSPAFYAFYIAAGVSDMADGAVARKTGAVSDFGSKFDTAADIVFAAACFIKMIPALDIPLWLMIWIIVIALIKTIIIFCGYVLHKQFSAEHTVMNKVTGIALFVLPFTITFIDLKYSGICVCALATFAVIYEYSLIRYDRIKEKNI